MSANNWRVCPCCLKRQEEAKAQALAHAERQYGKVPAAEYLALLDKAKATDSPGDTLREDWQIGLNEDGAFFVSYRGYCERCGFEFRFKHDEQVPLEDKKHKED